MKPKKTNCDCWPPKPPTKAHKQNLHICSNVKHKTKCSWNVFTWGSTNLYQGLNFKQYLPLWSWNKIKKKSVFQVESSYLPDFPREHKHSIRHTKGVLRRSVRLSQVDLSAEAPAQTPTCEWIFRHVHVIRGAVHTLHTLRARQLSIQPALLSGHNVNPHLHSYSCLIFLQPPSFSLWFQRQSLT